MQRREAFELGSMPTKLRIIGLLLCLLYYVYGCWMSSTQLSYQFSLWLLLLFGSGLAGCEISIGLMMPLSKTAKNALQVFLGINGAISAGGWLFAGYAGFLFLFFLVGLMQFFYFSCYSQQTSNQIVQ